MANELVDQYARLYIIRDTIDDVKKIIIFINHYSQSQRKDSRVGNALHFSDLEKLRDFLTAIGVNAWAKPVEFPKSEITPCSPDEFVNWLQQDPGRLTSMSVSLLVLDISQAEVERRLEFWQRKNTGEHSL